MSIDPIDDRPLPLTRDTTPDFNETLLTLALNSATGVALVTDDTVVAAQKRAPARRVQTMQSDDISTDAEEGSAEAEQDEAVEKVSTAVVTKVTSRLKTTADRERLASEIDGKTSNERSTSEAHAIGKTLRKIDDMDGLGITVRRVDRGTRQEVTAKDGEKVEVDLGVDQESKLQKTSSGKTLLIVSKDLSLDKVVSETASAVAKVIGEIAEEEGVDVVDDLTSALFEESFKVFFDWRNANAIRYSEYLAESMEV